MINLLATCAVHTRAMILLSYEQCASNKTFAVVSCIFIVGMDDLLQRHSSFSSRVVAIVIMILKHLLRYL